MEAYRENAILKSTAWQGLTYFMREHGQAGDQGVPDLEQFEREFLPAKLVRYDVQAQQVVVQGVVYGQPMTSTETYLSTAGSVTVARQWYRPAGRGSRHICPLEMRVGIVAGHFTPAAARVGAYVTANVVPAIGAELLSELGNLQPSAGELGRLPKDLSAQWETRREEWEAQLRSLESVPKTAVTLAISTGGQAIVTLRSLIQSQRWTHACALLRQSYQIRSKWCRPGDIHRCRWRRGLTI